MESTLQWVFSGMEKYLCSMDKLCKRHQDYKKETCNKLKRANVNMETIKIECAKVKKIRKMGVGMEMIRDAI
eukprot:2308046-Ditylum_brightwellii.AAC.1